MDTMRYFVAARPRLKAVKAANPLYGVTQFSFVCTEIQANEERCGSQ